MLPSVTGETTTNEAPVETEIDEALCLPSVLVSAGAFLFAFEIGQRR